ncbi:hypothetical protein HRR88_007031 [Exophiala dermatitidis]|nr:hypothetical protein HRR75_003460 [Exophiala dermatitidis]KAJ4520775.1 hypothetical protein HRR74_003776 [Exophiala dermatitidis]KAJ4521918.1 hypothetical protein HRR73_003117 [Exophiala dermatitidis]KAJ4551763.1 hypothetical protein HRR77_002990 [Exophiala dermatitidis]KAJ4569498.1 hypothetical protein HRR79_004344 [Exophiala dermatitidis]
MDVTEASASSRLTKDNAAKRVWRRGQSELGDYATDRVINQEELPLHQLCQLAWNATVQAGWDSDEDAAFRRPGQLRRE